ncbi:MAG: DUF6438 domain-containing protein [Candidatus Andeanibacterium colombiense]|uniref:DUF6438 domain-containing protein n=1 Tax=Candidatus Andeanibacterium colombiense TaxID=3121345 RepID=A0AAJ6BPD5_9SPHN|nr:MAG: DUF6438 domain-containing protein [Sphingomonadaceae bacterium]
MMRLIAVLAAALLAGCATTPGADTAPPQSVRFETTPCFGSCPVFVVTISADGHGTYEGGRFVKTKGTHEFTATPAQVQAFFERIRPFRPKGEMRYDYGHCPVPVATDSSSVDVRWSSPRGEDSLNWYLGCRVPALNAIEPDLRNAWQELPLDDLVGRAENRFEYDQRGG